jgi:cell wall-associated NlpC family hydrolase
VSAQHRLLRALIGGWKPLLVGFAAVGAFAPAAAARAEPSVQQIEAQISAQSTQIEKIVEQYNKVNEELKASQAAVDKGNVDLGPLTEQLTSASTRVGEIAATAYKGASLAKLSSVLEAGDPSTIVNRLQTLDRITKYEDGQFQHYLVIKARTDAEKAKLDKLVASQTAQLQTLDDQKKTIIADLARLEALRKKVAAQQQLRTMAAAAAATAVTPSTPPPPVAGKAGIAVSFAYAQLGKPYVWAAAGPSSYDCSGLTLAAWRGAGVFLPHNAAMQYNALPHISRGSLQPGDLVFYSGLGHEGIYVGNGQIIHAPTFGDHVRLASVDMMPPYGYARPR